MTPQRSLGRTLHGLPPGLRSLLPPGIRQSIRQRIGPFAPWEQGFSSAAPAPATGETTGPPDFVGIGVQKAGTSWWYELLCAHPAVHHAATAHKERHFFARFAFDEFGPQEPGQYHAWFPRPPGAVTGEWTPDYIHQPWAAPLLQASAPSARLLLMVRDPVERFVSGVAHEAPGPGSNLGAVLADALHRGFYAAALHSWVPRFAPDQLLVLQYERCVADPRGELERTWKFLGLDASLAATLPAARLVEPVSPTRATKRALSDDARRRLRELYAGDVAELLGQFPAIDRSLWPNFAGP
ncbi:MAG TPA: sulfotransferase domain-containing protein [Acidimicrobiales bacterium]|nr:sulfotransferase domain-containing protein [Acidimicrobiales bacterium]